MEGCPRVSDDLCSTRLDLEEIGMMTSVMTFVVQGWTWKKLRQICIRNPPKSVSGGGGGGGEEGICWFYFFGWMDL